MTAINLETARINVLEKGDNRFTRSKQGSLTTWEELLDDQYGIYWLGWFHDNKILGTRLDDLFAKFEQDIEKLDADHIASSEACEYEYRSRLQLGENGTSLDEEFSKKRNDICDDYYKQRDIIEKDFKQNALVVLNS
jgi:hypothetical protein